ncbi:MAG: 4-hydroxy-tetrahydrodipicolinate reductase [Pseudomonadota bacterium]
MRIALLGASGRMGKAIRALVAARPDTEIISGWDKDAGLALAPLLADADVAIDFTHESAWTAIADALAIEPCPLVSGTTGFSDQSWQALTRLSEHAPILHDGNMSIAVHVLTSLVAQAAAALPDYDIEIAETHHRGKRDAPSGTALKLGEAAATARHGALSELARYTRQGDCPRQIGEIGFAVQRGGAVIGDHDVSLFGPLDSLKISHHAADRKLFADGALRAARWLVQQPPGRYSIADMLGR